MNRTTPYERINDFLFQIGITQGCPRCGLKPTAHGYDGDCDIWYDCVCGWGQK